MTDKTLPERAAGAEQQPPATFWVTHNDDGDPTMLFFDRQEALKYDDAPKALVYASPVPAASVEATMPCGHHPSLMLRSAETGEPLFCELCDTIDRRNDAERREQELLAQVQAPATPAGAPVEAQPAAPVAGQAQMPLTEVQVAAIVREACKGAATRRDGTTTMRIVRGVEAAHGIQLATPSDTGEQV